MKHLSEYTGQLKGVFLELLSDYRGGGSNMNAVTCLEHAKAGHESWKTETADGKLYVDWRTDVDKRWSNLLSEDERTVGRDTVVEVD